MLIDFSNIIGQIVIVLIKHTKEGVDVDMISDVVKNYLPQKMAKIILGLGHDELCQINEIRLRSNRPMMLVKSDDDFFITKDGTKTKNLALAIKTTSDEILDTLNLICCNSIYAYMDTIRSGFITIKGGHRVGITGKSVIENGKIKNIKDVSSINIRIAREIKGVGLKMVKYIIRNKNDIYNTLIISPPAYGKTTLLRDVVRILSDGFSDFKFKGMKISIVDERSEIAALFNGVPQNDVGIRSDVIDGCSKCEGMILALRSMSPQIIATDEIGSSRDFEVLRKIISCGVRIITTAHGFDILDVAKRDIGKIFDRFVILGKDNKVGSIKDILDGSTLKSLVKEA